MRTFKSSCVYSLFSFLEKRKLKPKLSVFKVSTYQFAVSMLVILYVIFPLPDISAAVEQEILPLNIKYLFFV